MSFTFLTARRDKERSIIMCLGEVHVQLTNYTKAYIWVYQYSDKPVKASHGQKA